MERISFCEFMDAVKVAPITPMQALELMSIVFQYMMQYGIYCNAVESNCQTMAFWEMKDLAGEYEQLRKKLSGDIPPLESFKRAIY